MRLNLNEQFGSNILTLFRNGITWCNIPITVTLIAFDLIYSKFSEQCPTSCLGIATTALALNKKLQKFYTPLPPLIRTTRLLKSSENSDPFPPPIVYFEPTFPFIRHLRVSDLFYDFTCAIKKIFRRRGKDLQKTNLVLSSSPDNLSLLH